MDQTWCSVLMMLGSFHRAWSSCITGALCPPSARLTHRCWSKQMAFQTPGACLPQHAAHTHTHTHTEAILTSCVCCSLLPVLCVACSVGYVQEHAMLSLPPTELGWNYWITGNKACIKCPSINFGGDLQWPLSQQLSRSLCIAGVEDLAASIEEIVFDFWY